MGVLGSKCCSGEEARESKDAAADGGAVTSVTGTEEVVKSDAPLVVESHAVIEASRPLRKDEEPESFTVILKKAGGVRLGVDVDLTDGQSLLVDRVNEGLVSEWNKANPDRMIRKNDRIVTVNRETGNAQLLTEVCKRDDVLEMLIRRGD